MANSTALSTFSFNGSTINAVGTVSLGMSRDPINVTAIGSANSYFVAGVQSTGLSLDVFYSSTDHAGLIANVWTAASAAAFTVTTVSGDVYSGVGLVVGFDLVAASSDVVRAKFDIVVSGPLLINGTEETILGANESSSIPAP